MSDHLHAYEVVEEYPDAIIEVCRECGHRLVTKVYNDGRINNKEYLDSHERDFIQRNDPRFEKYYPEQVKKDKEIEQNQEEFKKNILQ